MSDLPVCKLCGCQPTRNPDGKLGHKRGSRCKLVSAVYFNDEEWQTLMSTTGGEAVAQKPVAWVYETTHGRAVSFNSIQADDLQKGTIVTPLFAHPSPAADDAVLRDSERYRFIRDPCSGAEKVIYYPRGDYGNGLYSGETLDSAIDAAMAKEQGDE